MQTITSAREMYDRVKQAQADGKTVGVVPTMGALHEGHLSLVEAARSECDFVVTTIFVNPTQFAPGEDLEKYPRPLDQDLAKLRERAVDAAFCPDEKEVYPPGFSTYVDPPAISLPLEGQSRTNHFRGVATVVLKLFHMVPAECAFFGQKDFQQTLVIKKMVTDLNLPVKIVVCPIVREPDGLAMSSRNAYLSPEDRERAIGLHQCLAQTKQDIEEGMAVDQAIQKNKLVLATAVDELEYLEVVSTESLERPGDTCSDLVALVAARVGSTRLIDNMLINRDARTNK